MIIIVIKKGRKRMTTPRNISNYLEKNHLYIQEVTRLDVDPYEFLTNSDDPSSYVNNSSADCCLELVDKESNILARGTDEEILNRIREMMKYDAK